SGFTDWLDGKLARVLGQTSRLGALLDPLVDRLYVVTTLVTFVARDFIPWWVAAILIGRDLLLALTLPIYRRRGLPPPEVVYLGKAATFLLMFALPLILAGHGDWAIGPFTHAFGFAFLIWGTVLYVWTAVIYVLKAVDVARTHEVVPR
ncbi:MAG: CDP-alcohol phosphatidyltransferase family protein, partial [Rhodococcus sp. (in: high G+C Gram-positive bacteria)]